jgi:response regulator RpfG family c-di-GMP phosphodiesterase
MSRHDDGLALVDSAEPETTAVPAQLWKVLIADDDKAIHAVTQLSIGGSLFHGRPIVWLHAYTGEEAVSMMRDHDDIALILMDVVMEHDNAGLDAAQRIRQELRNSFVRIAVRTGQAGVQREEDVVRRYGVDDYREKTELTATRLFTLVHTSLAHYDQLRKLDQARVDSEMAVAINEALEAHRDGDTHERRVAEYSRLLAQLAGLDSRSTSLLFQAAPLREAAARVVSDTDPPVLRAAAMVAGQRTERWDGQGYPHGIRGEDIHIFGRITALTDVFDALTHPRFARDAWPLQQALEYLVQESGRRFDPSLVELFMKNLDQFIDIHNRMRDRAGEPRVLEKATGTLH